MGKKGVRMPTPWGLRGVSEQKIELPWESVPPGTGPPPKEWA